jgi:hypothetical protein
MCGESTGDERLLIWPLLKRKVSLSAWAGIFKKSMGARHWVGRGLSYRPARLHRLAEFIPSNRFLDSINVEKYGLWLLLFKENREKRTAMEFLALIWLKTQVFCSMLFTVPYTFQILQHNILYSGFENPYKKIRETRKLKSIYEQQFVERKRG